MSPAPYRPGRHPPRRFERRDGTQVGFVVGGGLEHTLARDWSVKLEYQYIDLGSERLVGTPGFAGFSTNSLDTAFHTVRLGLNYRFHEDRYAPVKLHDQIGRIYTPVIWMARHGFLYVQVYDYVIWWHRVLDAAPDPFSGMIP